MSDVGALFADPAVNCVIVEWDTDMSGAEVRPDGGIGTPGALDAAARAGGFVSPCESTLDPRQPSVDRAWYIARFRALHPTARYWGVTLFLRTPQSDGVDSRCAMVVRQTT